jgi:acyl-CoA dehydrogenase
MVDFALSEVEELVAQTARDYAQRELAPLASNRDKNDTFPVSELMKLAELGLLGVNVPEKFGGAEAGSVAYALVMVELARACPSTSVAVAVTNMAAELISRFGTEEQGEKIVGRIVSGDACCAAFALSEPQCGSDASALQTRAERHPDGWMINGTKQWITSGDKAGTIVVWARTSVDAGARGLSAFVFERDPAVEYPGLSIGRHEDKMGLRGSSTVPLIFENCVLPADALLGNEGDGFKLAMVALDGGRIGIGAQALGIGLSALEQAVAYAKERKTFGKLIGQHQGIQWMLADAATELEMSRLLVMRAASLKQAGLPFTKEASMAKLHASETANRVCFDSLQIHGGYGYTKDYPLERMSRDARVTTIYEGTSEIQRLVIGRSILQQFSR